MEEQLRKLEIKKARLLSEIEMLSEVSPMMFQNLGKAVAEIHIIKKKVLQETKNTTDED